MSSELPTRPQASQKAWTIAFVASLYNEVYVNGLLDAAREELSLILPQAEILVYRVPGSFEIPVATAKVLDVIRPDAVLCFGLILQGETAHADLIAQSVTQSLQQLALENRTPVLHEVLLVKNTEQAKARCLDSQINRGIEAARAVVRLLTLFDSLYVSSENSSEDILLS